ncbi:MAG: SDR family NAD(P)-dependent oxidoreductase [Bacteroidota bacterium]
MPNIAMVTGATSGIGEATAQLFARHGYNLIVTGRRKDRLDRLAEALQREGAEVLPLCFDVRDQPQVAHHLEGLTEAWQGIDVLVNNAGLAVGAGTIDQGALDDWERMIDTNVKGLLYVSRAVIPYFKRQGSGHIINIGSVAGKEVYKGGNVYCATKHGVDALTKGMRIDLLPLGIRVSSVCPGAAETEFSVVRYHGDQAKADTVYEGFTPLYAEDIAETIYFVASRPRHVTINDVLIMPTAQANTSHLLRKNSPS